MRISDWSSDVCSSDLVDVDLDLLDRLQALARRGVVAIEHARARDGELEAFAAHRLDQHAELQPAAPGHLEGILLGGTCAAEGDVALRLAHTAVAEPTRGRIVTFPPGPRRIVTTSNG